MILTVRDFCSYIEDDELDVLAQQVTQSTARPIDENVRESYSEVSKMLTKAMKKNPAIGDCHIAYDTSMVLEYKLPSASAWCDLILLGKN
ncbi:MAG: hypothetical protein HUJ98_09425, partial [Bacteroidaceae bacterium]|nr:hypothetical protein [Bacteroidaceae bacterium]